MDDMAADLNELKEIVHAAEDVVLLERREETVPQEYAFEHLSSAEVEKQCLVTKHGDIQKVQPSGKLAYAFLLDDRLTFAKMWNSFFEAAEPGTYSAVVHLAEGAMAADAPPISFEYQAVTHTGSAWCNVTFVMVEALREAVKDPDVAGVVYVSDSHIPLKHPNTIRNMLLGEDRSIFRSHGCTDLKCKAEMWSYMRRKDVEYLLDDWYNHGGKDLANRLVHYNISKTHPLHIAGCGDEKYPLWAIHKWQGDNPKMEYSRRPIYTMWNGMLGNLGEEEYLQPYVKGHPAVFQNVSARTYFHMRQSCSVFARKVLPNSTFQGQMPLVDYIENEMLNVRS
uniref:Protein xylosyltransferase n=2 Tax=Lotharella globosa TaxID=91324 RepID=A0A7S4E064_9EUKA